MSKYNFELDLDTTNTMSVIIKRIKNGSKVLEFGPANGRLTKYLSEVKECQVDIVEIDEVAGQSASQFAKKAFIGTEEGNIENYLWEHNEYQYDYIIFADVLEHLYNPKDVLIRAMKILNNQGKILVSIPNVAHNSVIIDLINDEFKYSATGLLDDTHIRFYTYKSFKRVVNEIGLTTTLEIPIYSRVGFNEIKNDYRSVPSKVENTLRRRKTGSIYQYVFELKCSKENSGINLCTSQLDVYKEYEAICYIKEQGQDDYNENLSVKKVYNLRQNEIIIDLKQFNHIEGIRFDPLTENAIYLLEQVQIKIANKVQIIEGSRSNAEIQIGKIYIFETIDPQIFFDIELGQIEEIRIRFEILDERIENFNAYRSIIEELKTNYINKNQLLEKINIIKQQKIDNKILKEVIQHRDKDIEILNNTIKLKEINLQEALQVIEHRDRDITILNRALEEKQKQLILINKEIEAIKQTKIYKFINKFKK